MAVLLPRLAGQIETLVCERQTVWPEPVLEAEVRYGRIVGGQLREPMLRRFVTERVHASPAQRPSRRRRPSFS